MKNYTIFDSVMCSKLNNYALIPLILTFFIMLNYNDSSTVLAEEDFSENELDITDLNEKIKELTQAANSGNVNAQYSLGRMALENNKPPDHATAVYWFRIAAESDHLEAIEILGAHLFMGLGVPQDAEQAKEWWMKAANKGSVKAQASLGVLFALGNGIEKDLIESYKWFTLAARNGNEEAKIQRDNSIALQLSADQIREAQERVNEFSKK